MRLPRPYIPMRVRAQVAWTQANAAGCDPEKTIISRNWSYKDQLHALLYLMFGDVPVHLDHDPPLMHRQRYADKTGIRYKPDANDPEFLIYRTAHDHRIKTWVRGDGAQYSDAALTRKNKRIARNRNKRKPKRRWPSRPFPKRTKR